MTYQSRGTAERCKESSRGLSEHCERYPRLKLTASFFAHLRRAKIFGDLTYRGLRASRLPPATLLAPLRGALQ